MLLLHSSLWDPLGVFKCDSNQKPELLYDRDLKLIAKDRISPNR